LFPGREKKKKPTDEFLPWRFEKEEKDAVMQEGKGSKQKERKTRHTVAFGGEERGRSISLKQKKEERFRRWRRSKKSAEAKKRRLGKKRERNGGGRGNMKLERIRGKESLLFRVKKLITFLGRENQLFHLETQGGSLTA